MKKLKIKTEMLRRNGPIKTLPNTVNSGTIENGLSSAQIEVRQWTHCR